MTTVYNNNFDFQNSFAHTNGDVLQCVWITKALESAHRWCWPQKQENFQQISRTLCVHIKLAVTVITILCRDGNFFMLDFPACQVAFDEIIVHTIDVQFPGLDTLFNERKGQQIRQ